MLLNPSPEGQPNAPADTQAIVDLPSGALVDSVFPSLDESLRDAPAVAVPTTEADAADQVALAGLESMWQTSAQPQGVYAQIGKPLLDRAIALVLLFLTFPILLAGLLTVRLTMGPNVIFRQTRVGLEGRTFTVLKLRTMGHDRRATTEEDLEAFANGQWDGIERRQTHKTDLDPRHTAIGQTLRRLSIDELPQLINVLKGEMSIVGPRPELPGVIERHYSPWMHRRHVVRPGITGLWQISMRGEGDMHEHVDVDLDYVDSMSFTRDMQILLATPLAALGKHKGA